MKLWKVVAWIVLGLLALLAGAAGLIVWYDSGFGDPNGPIDQRTMYGARGTRRSPVVRCAVTDWRHLGSGAAPEVNGSDRSERGNT